MKIYKKLGVIIICLFLLFVLFKIFVIDILGGNYRTGRSTLYLINNELTQYYLKHGEYPSHYYIEGDQKKPFVFFIYEKEAENWYEVFATSKGFIIRDILFKMTPKAIYIADEDGEWNESKFPKTIFDNCTSKFE